jgi:hypothetical protein
MVWSSQVAKRLVAGAVVAALSMVGCGGSESEKPGVAPVKGTVFFKGAPLAGATVSFYGPGSGVPSTGTSNEQGEFELTTFTPGDGAPIGENVVTVTKYEGSSAAPSAGDPASIITGGAPPTTTPGSGGPKSVLPEHYGNVISTPLKITIEADKTNTPKLELN